MKKSKLNSILKQHEEWVKGNIKGKKADLYGANLCGADLREANLSGANLYEADLYKANLCGANLNRANLYEANLCEADLCGADLCKADLCGANLCGANLYGANLSGANLCGANLYGADLYGADLCRAIGIIHFQFEGFDIWCQKNKAKIGCHYGTYNELFKITKKEAVELVIEEKHYRIYKQFLKLGQRILNK